MTVIDLNRARAIRDMLTLDRAIYVRPLDDTMASVAEPLNVPVLGDTMASVAEPPIPKFRQEAVLDRADNAIHQIGDNVIWQIDVATWIELLQKHITQAYERYAQGNK